MKNMLSAVACVFFFFSFSAFAADTPAKPASAPVSANQTPSVSKHVPVAGHEIININTADAQTLAQLNGVGPRKAEAIVAFRKANGNFKSIDQLADVKGIGAKTLEANRKNIRI